LDFPIYEKRVIIPHYKLSVRIRYVGIYYNLIYQRHSIKNSHHVYHDRFLSVT
jgi:hypothetical protein